MAILLCLLAAVAFAKPGDLDRGFAGDGIAELANNTKLRGAAVQRDGKLVAAGVQGTGANVQLLVARFTTSGALDRKFSGDGIFLGAPGTAGNDVAIQPNGRIVVAGNAGLGTEQAMMALRLTAGGALDRSFSGDGIATAFAGRNSQGRAVTLDGSKVLVAGSAVPPSGGDGLDRVALARFNANGSPDGGFGSGGAAFHDFGRLSFANDVAVQSNGRIVIAGQQRNDLQTTNVLAARLKSNGAPDPSFGENSGIPGLFLQQYAKGGSSYSAAFGVGLAAGGKVVLGGSALDANVGSQAIAVRLTGAGKADRTFSGDGVAYLPATSNRNQFTPSEPYPGAESVAISGSTILLGGYFDAIGAKQPAVWALRSNGSPDNRFGTQGRTIVTSFGQTTSAELADIALAGDGKVYGVGGTESVFGAPKGLAFRFVGLPIPVQLTVSVKRVQKLGPALRRGIPVTMRCNQACTLNAVLKAAGSTVAKANGKLRAAGKKVLKVRFTKQGKRKLAGRKRVAAKLITTAKSGKKTDRVTKSILLRR